MSNEQLDGRAGRDRLAYATPANSQLPIANRHARRAS